jgi:hypothetical protein
MPDENTTTTAAATQPAPASAPAENVKPETEQPAPTSADLPKPEDAQPATATVESSGTRQSPAVTRAPTRVARGVSRKGAPNTTAAASRQAKPAKPAAPAKPKVPDYRKLKLNADDVIGGVRKVNPWKEGTKGHGYYAKYRTGITVAEAVKAGVPRGYVAWDVAHGFITLKPEG